MARRNTIDDSDWDEVMFINGYAVFMGYLMMGVRGLGILVITWTTVVLLGGFVSVLGKKDLWCLTGITLVETAGVFNVLLEETMSDFLRSWWGLLGAAVSTITKPFKKGKGKAVLYLLGMYISAGVSLWRLIEHDFGNDDGGPNLKPALQVLYSLAVAQGVLFGYKQMHALGAKIGLAEFVAEALIESEEIKSVDKDTVSAYLEDIVAGCEKDPSFATGRNLVTYAVDLIVEAKSNDGFIAGVKILGTFRFHRGRRLLAKHLLSKSASSSHMIQRLLETLGPRSPYSSEIREKAACVVSLVAQSIHLEQYPVCIECISSLLDTFEEYSWVPEGYGRRDHRLPKEYERDWLLEQYERGWLLEQYERGWLLFETEPSSVDSTTSAEDAGNLLLLREYYGLVRQGLIILQRLSIREDNCKVITNTEGLLLKITAPLISKQLHRDHHDLWSDIAQESMQLMMQLLATPGNTGTKIQSEEAIICTFESIFECPECEPRLKRRAKCPSTHVLRKNSDIGRLACEKLLTMLSSNQEPSAMQRLQRRGDQGSPTSMLQAVRFVLGDLTRAFLDAGNVSNRVIAGRILDHLWCSNH
ncbi:hypothetical protein QOZ80_5BG0441540 [Eleusine coracana subsp. coracana]|nr:hypothetical protein QOZ80_5BG0441540 [Eleusine coracana subsp. coracana]